MPFEVSVLVQHLLMVNVKIKPDACCSIYFGNDPVNLARQESKPVANQKSIILNESSLDKRFSQNVFTTNDGHCEMM